MIRVLTYDQIDFAEWQALVASCQTGTWFQSPEAYEFYASLPEVMEPFVLGVQNTEYRVQTLRGVCVGYVTKERNKLKHFFTRRAIILGGPVLSDDCSDAEVATLLEAVKTKTRHPQSLDSDLPETTPQSSYMHASRQSEDLSRVAGEQPDASQKHSLSVGSVSPTTFPVRSQKSIGFSTLTKNIKNRLRNLSPIYIETRNFNDYGKWREAFERAGFSYKKHLNFHVDCRDEKEMWERLSENRKRQIRKGEAVIEIIENKNKENTAEAEENIKKQEIKNTHSTSALLYGLHGLECNQPQTPTNELAAFVDANTPNLLPNNSTLNASKNATPSYENTKNIEDILEWYGILERLYRTKVKTPLWPVEFFLEAYRQGIGQFHLVRYEGRIIGGSMVVADARCVYEWFECGLNARYKDQYPSVTATYAGMKGAQERGCRRYDMMGAGEPGVPYGVRDFKAEFGGELVEHGRFLCICHPLLYRIGVRGVQFLKRHS